MKNLLELLEDAPKELTALVPAEIGDAVHALAEVVEIGKQLIDAGAAHDLPDLLEKLRTGIASPAAETIFTDLGQKPLYDKLKALSGEYAKLPPEAKLLLSPLSEFEETASSTDTAHPDWATGSDPGRIGWSTQGDFLTPKLAADHGIAGSFTLGGAIALDCEAGSLWFYTRDKVSSKGLLRIGVAGELGANVKGQIPFHTVDIDLGAQANASADAHLFWRMPPERLYVSALARALARPINIFSLTDVWNASRTDEFEGFIVALDGSVGLDIGLAIAREFDFPGLFSGTAGLKVTVDLSRQAKYELSVRKLDNGNLRVVLSHGDKDVDSWSVGAKLGIDAGPLFERVGEVLKGALDHWDALLKDIKPFLTPGTYLQGKLSGLADKLLQGGSPLLDDLRSDLRIVLGGGQLDSLTLADALRKEITGAIGKLEKTAIAVPGDLADKVIQDLSRKLPALADAGLAQKVRDEVEQLLAGFQGEFESTIDELVKAGADPVIAALNKLGNFVGSVGAKADRAASGIKKLVEDFDAILQKVVAATQDAALAKISARLDFEKSHVEQEDIEFAGEFFSPDDPAAQDLYRALMFGKISRLVELVEQPTKIAGFGLYPAECSIHRFSKVSRSLGYELVVLGVDFTGKAEISGSADVTLQGDEVTVKATAASSRKAKGYKQSRSISFVETYSLIAAKVERDGLRPAKLQPGITFDMSVTRDDKTLETKEILQFLSRMVRVGLISGARSTNMQAYLTEMTKTRGTTKIQGVITLSFALSLTDIQNLVKLGGGIDAVAPKEDRGADARTVFSAGLDAIIEAGEWTKQDFLRWMMLYGHHPDIPDGGTDFERAKARLFASRDKPFNSPGGPHAPQGNINARDEARRCQALNGLVTLLALLEELYNAVPRGIGDPNLEHWTEQRYRATQKKIADATSSWLLLGQQLVVFFTPGISPRVVALFLALVHLAGIEKTGGDGGLSNPGTYDAQFRLSLALAGEEAKSF